MINDLKQKIIDAKYISFDIFDTAILRLVKDPDDIFKYISEKHNNETFKPNFNFCKTRSQAEQSARFFLCNELREDVNLSEIYKYFAQISYDQSIAKVYYEAEIDAECKFSTKNPYIYELYKFCLENNKPVIFTSDMYLEKETIEFILDREGYKEYNKLYLSSELMKTKKSGNLFKFIIKDMQCSPFDILHIGDNEHSDIKVASEIGLNTYHYKNPEKAREQKYLKNKINIPNSSDSILSSIYYGIVNKRYYSNHELKNDDFWFDLGYKNIGLIAYGFCKWVIECVESQKCDKVYFLARDAYLFHKIVDLITLETGSKFEARYLYTSRRALRFARIRNNINEDDLEYLASNNDYIGMSLKDVLNRIDIDYSDYNLEIKECGFSEIDQKIVSDFDFKKLKKLFKVSKIEKEILEKAEIEREALLKYLEQEGVFNATNIALIDIGWHGNLQRAFNDLIKEYSNAKVQGFYFGTRCNPLDETNDESSLKGFYINNNVPTSRAKIINSNSLLIEAIFTAPSSSLKCFEINKNGEAEPCFISQNIDQNEINKILKIHDGAMEFSKDLEKVMRKNEIFDFDKDFALELLKRLHDFPTKEEAEMIGDITPFDSLGQFPKLAEPLPMYKYFVNPISSYYHYSSSAWREAYLCRLCGGWILNNRTKYIFYGPRKMLRKIKNNLILK